MVAVFILPSHSVCKLELAKLHLNLHMYNFYTTSPIFLREHNNPGVDHYLGQRLRTSFDCCNSIYLQHFQSSSKHATNTYFAIALFISKYEYFAQYKVDDAVVS